MLELALTTLPALDGDQVARSLAEHVAIALAWAPVYLGAQALFVEPEHAEHWTRLAEQTAGDNRRRMLTLAALCRDRDVLSVDPADVGELVTEQDLQLFEAAQLAEAAGDFPRALDCLGRAVRPLDDGWRRDLEQLVASGEDLHPARWGRYICSAAMRFCLSHPVGRDMARKFALVVLQAIGAPPDELTSLLPSRAVGDQVVHDAVLFDDAGLAGYLDVRLSADVASRVLGLAEWPDAPPTVLRYDAAVSDGARCVDLVNERSLVLGDEGFAADQEVGTRFYGRLVRIDGESRQYFAMLPTIVDEVTAARLVRSIRADEPAERRLAAMYATRCSTVPP